MRSAKVVTRGPDGEDARCVTKQPRALCERGRVISDAEFAMPYTDRYLEIEPSRAESEHVREALAARVTHACRGVRVDQRMGGEPAGRHGRHEVREVRVARGLRGTDARFEQSLRSRRQRHLHGLVAPAVPPAGRRARGRLFRGLARRHP